MTSTNLLVSEQPDDPEGNLQINIPRSALGDFLSGLLGQPRSTKKVFYKAFDIDHTFLCNLDRIVHQRIVSHQEASLASFNAVIEFQDDRTQTVNSREAFATFNDLSDAPSNRSSLTWIYLVKFPQRNVPDKQEISLTLDTGRLSLGHVTSPEVALNRYLRSTAKSYEPQITIQVNYTDMMWGLELSRHIENELQKRQKNSNSFTRYFRIAMAMLTPLVSMGSIMMGPMAAYQFVQFKIERAIRYELLGGLTSSIKADQEILLRLRYIMNDGVLVSPFSHLGYWLLLFAILMLNIAMWFYVSRTERSYLILNAAAESQKVRDAEKRRRMTSSLFVTLLVGAVAGFLGNHLTYIVDELGQ